MNLTYLGLKIVENPMLTKTIEDWSRVRSPSRARRRRWKHRQNIKTLTVPSDQMYMMGDTVICHPAKVRELRKALEDNLAKAPEPVRAPTTTANQENWTPLMQEMFKMNAFRTNPIFRHDVV